MSSENEEIIALMAISVCVENENTIRAKKRKQRFWSEHFYTERAKYSHVPLLKELETKSEKKFKNFVRMNNENYQELLKMVEPLIKKKDTFMRDAITPHERLSATLRFLSSGESFEDLKFLTAISPHSLSRIVIETCEAIIKTLKDYIQLPKTENDWKCIANDFNTLWNFPNCIGAIDGKHVEIMKPPGTGSYYYNYKKSYSIVMMAIVNAKYEFIAVEVGANGRASDAGIFGQSKFKQKYDDNELHIPQAASVPMCQEKLPFVFIGDDAFPLMENLIKPFSRTQLSRDEIIFNYRLSRARRVVENAFGILCRRFRVLANRINLSPNKVSIIVLACCYIHNFLTRKNGAQYTNDSVNAENGRSSETLNNCGLSNLRPLQGGNSTNAAKSVRNKYKEYFNTVGSVPWQNDIV